MTENINALVKYIIWKAKRSNLDRDLDNLIENLYKLTFEWMYLPFERFFLALIMHPNDSASIKIALVILNGLLAKPDVDNCRGVRARLEALYRFLPANSALLTYSSHDFFRRMVEYRKEFSDYDFEKLSIIVNEDGLRGYNSQVPMYYSNLAERLIPVVDMLFLRAFEVEIDASILEQFIKTFAPIYRYHRVFAFIDFRYKKRSFLAQPITFLYKLAYMLDDIASPHLLGRFASKVCMLLEEDKTTARYPFLTYEYLHVPREVSSGRGGCYFYLLSNCRLDAF